MPARRKQNVPREGEQPASAQGRGTAADGPGMVPPHAVRPARRTRAPGTVNPRARADKEQSMSMTVDAALKEAMAVEGAIGAALVDYSSGMSLGAISTTKELDLTVEHCKNRIVFGKPLIQKQVVRHKLVEMTRAVEVSRSYTHVIMERIHNGEKNLFAQAAMAKNQAVEACDFVVDQAVQLHGGMGYMRDSEVERHYRDSKILGIGGGATEVMNDLIAKALFG